jgi:glutaredoxin 3
MALAQPRVVVYTTGYCGFCHAAKRLLELKGVPYLEIAVDHRPDLRRWLVEVSSRTTVPQVFLDGESIGGFTELQALESCGELDSRLSAAPSVDNVNLRS